MTIREGSLEAPTRHPVAWRLPDFYDEAKLLAELERIFGICHGCRRCVNLCTAFPTLFDLVDASATLEVDGVEKSQFWKVVDQCYLCDMCYMTKCPYVPPHPWNVDFPHLMLRAKAVKFRKGEVKLRDRLLSSTDAIGKLAAIPVVAQVVNAVNRNAAARSLMERAIGVHRERKLPPYSPGTFRGRAAASRAHKARNGELTPGKVVVFSTCYVNYNEPGIGHDLLAVLDHNEIPYVVVEKEACCGMPKLELGDLEGVERLKAVSEAMFDPFEYFVLRKRDGLLKTDFKKPLGKVSYHIPCHSRVQNMGQKTRETLQFVPGTTLNTVERCSGHDGTWGVKSEYYENSMKIGRPVFRQMAGNEPDYVSSDCPIAARHIEQGMGESRAKKAHPLSLLRIAYGI